MTWKLRYTAGSGELLHTPLKSGQTMIDRDVPVIVDNLRDYRRLMRSGKYEEIKDAKEKPKEKPVATVVAEDASNK